MNATRLVLSLGLFAGAFALLAAACQQDLSPQQPCRDIPEGGCPAYDNACMDPTCFTLYSCGPDDRWQVEQVCPAKEAGAPVDAGASDASSNLGDSGYLNVPGALGGPGCQDLQTPDCALGVAAACTSNDCCDCQDLYVCDNGGWNLWGECANGQITQNQ